jgi:uncharacterized membrane protein
MNTAFVKRTLVRTVATGVATSALLMMALLLAVTPVLADFRLCNRTSAQVSIAIGYKSDKTWRTEGWWNMPPNSCHTLLEGVLSSRYYYVYAVDETTRGEWGGKAFMCTQDRMFTIDGIEECVKRGYQRTGFFEIDTGDHRSWTVQLTEPEKRGPTPSAAAPQAVKP